MLKSKLPLKLSQEELMKQTTKGARPTVSVRPIQSAHGQESLRPVKVTRFRSLRPITKVR